MHNVAGKLISFNIYLYTLLHTLIKGSIAWGVAVVEGKRVPPTPSHLMGCNLGARFSCLPTLQKFKSFTHNKVRRMQIVEAREREKKRERERARERERVRAKLN